MGWSEEQKLANRQRIIEEFRKPGDSDEQAYERYRSHMRQIALNKPPRSEETIEKHRATMENRHGKDWGKRFGKMGGRPKQK